jgi:hypothetical protein
MYNKVVNETLTKEKTRNNDALRHESDIPKNWEQLMSFNKRQDVTQVKELKKYETPQVCVVRNYAYEQETEINENLRPTSTTEQFKASEDNEIYSDIRQIKEVKKSNKIDKEYKINTKGKLLIAVYALVVITIFSLIILNSRMLRNLDNSIDNYASQVTKLSEEYDVVVNELNHVMSDEEVIKKAIEMGMERA